MKVSVDKVRELAAHGLPASEIASQLGVARQAIYQLAARMGVILPRAASWNAGRGQTTWSIPRIVTGGVMQPVNAHIAGTVSELLVAADLLARGWEPYFPITRCRGHDLIAVRQDIILTVEVRSGRILKTGKIAYSKQMRRIASQYFAIVIVGRPVSYEPDLPG